MSSGPGWPWCSEAATQNSNVACRWINAQLFSIEPVDYVKSVAVPWTLIDRVATPMQSPRFSTSMATRTTHQTSKLSVAVAMFWTLSHDLCPLNQDQRKRSMPQNCENVGCLRIHCAYAMTISNGTTYGEFSPPRPKRLCACTRSGPSPLVTRTYRALKGGPTKGRRFRNSERVRLSRSCPRISSRPQRQSLTFGALRQQDSSKIHRQVKCRFTHNFNVMLSSQDWSKSQNDLVDLRRAAKA